MRRPAAPTGSTLDEMAAAAARASIEDQGLACLEPPPQAYETLSVGESLLAVHPSVIVDRREFCACPDASRPSTASVWLTSHRLLFLGPARLAISLDRIDEALIAGPRHLLLILHGGTGLSLEMDFPRLLRVQVAAARARHRAIRGADDRLAHMSAR
jgi:hypothetical protein